MKYYLLTFDEDYADEHNVPALDCFTEQQYNKWLKTPSGKINPAYKTQLIKHEEYEKAWKDFWALLNGSANTGKIPSTDLETLKIYFYLSIKCFIFVLSN
jgi:hypothetical protein